MSARPRILKTMQITLVICLTLIIAYFSVLSFLRWRKRSQATKIGGGVRIYEPAIDQWAIENNKVNLPTFEFSNVSDYIKASMSNGRSSGTDILNNTYIAPSGTNSPSNSADLSDVTRKEFWESYAPKTEMPPAATP